MCIGLIQLVEYTNCFLFVQVFVLLEAEDKLDSVSQKQTMRFLLRRRKLSQEYSINSCLSFQLA